MVLYVAMAKSEEDYLDRTRESLFEHKLRFEELSGWPCLMMRYCWVGPAVMDEYPIRAIIISGFGHGWDEMALPELYGLYDLLHTLEVPVLGICGGHQLLAHVFTKDFRSTDELRDQPMRRLQPGEPDWAPDYHPGYFVESGIQPVAVVHPDPLFAELPEVIYVRQSHFCEVKRLPADFRLLASSDHCRLQAMRHATRPIYGVQFHPELYTDYYPHGRQILRNFFALAGADTEGPVTEG